MKELSEQDKRINEIKAREEEAFVERAATRFDIPYVNLVETSIETDALALIDEKQAQENLMAAFKVAGKDLYIAVKSPRFEGTRSILDTLSKKYNIGVFLVSTKSLKHAWERYADISHTTRSLDGMLDITKEELEELSEKISNNEKIGAEIRKIVNSQDSKKVSLIMEALFGGAITTHSSDVHLEAEEDDVRVRFRQDGILQDIANIDHGNYKKILSRIKLLSKMKLTNEKNAQDGRFTIEIAEKEIEVRVSVIPSAYGESFVMRILNPDGINVGFESLGIEPKLFELIKNEIRKPNGMILTTGPTGSGKTTTLYSALKEIHSEEVKILTIEDPIEYHLDGISQTQVNREKGYTFLSGLRAVLRQDPDVVMVGEIRDAETARIAVNASLTGHLVLSTLHTNSAAGVIPRLIDLGVSPQILAASLSVSLAQRLVRKLCTCSKKRIANEHEQKILSNIYKDAEGSGVHLSEYKINYSDQFMVHEAGSCERCNGTGYKGRIGIFEAIITDEYIEDLLNKRPSEQDIRYAAKKQGLLDMKQDALVKVLHGVTSLEEIEKVVDMELDSSYESRGVKDQNTESHYESSYKKVFHRKQNPQALLENHSEQIALLTDYMQMLENQQRINPNISAEEKIREIKESILHLVQEDLGLVSADKAESISQENKKKLNSVTDHLEVLEKEQRKNPELSMANQIKKLRMDIIHSDVEDKT